MKRSEAVATKRVGISMLAGFGLGGLLALSSAGGTAACIIPDYCIAFIIPTVNVCKSFENAVDLTTGLPLVDEGGTLSQGCVCRQQQDADVLLSGDAEDPAFQVLEAELDGAARLACVELAIENGLSADETNCMTADEVMGGIQDVGVGLCESRFCIFGNPPPGGECPPDGSLCPGATPSPGTDGPPMTNGGSPGSEAGPGADSTG